MYHEKCKSNGEVLTEVTSGQSSYSAGLDRPLSNIYDLHQDVQRPARPLHRDTEVTPSERSPGSRQTQRRFRLSGRVTQTTRREDGPDWTLNRGEPLPLFLFLLLLWRSDPAWHCLGGGGRRAVRHAADDPIRGDVPLSSCI